MSRFAQYYGKYKHDADCYDWEQRQQHLSNHAVLLIIFYVENLDVGSWGVKNDV